MTDSMKNVCELAEHQASIARVHLENIISILEFKIGMQHGDELERTMEVANTLTDLHKQLVNVERKLEEIKKADV